MLPATRLFTLDPVTAERRAIPLAQASQGAYAGSKLVFTRFETNGSNTKRYRGGFLQQLWAWDGGHGEARRLMPGDSAASRSPMVWNDRVYFVGDRDLDMNLWSVALDGSDARQHTHHHGWDVRGAAMSDGSIVYQLGADLRVYDSPRTPTRRSRSGCRRTWTRSASAGSRSRSTTPRRSTCRRRATASWRRRAARCSCCRSRAGASSRRRAGRACGSGRRASCPTARP